MAMFDWNDEELTDIIWGRAGENDDHIVPYSEKNSEKHLIMIGDGTQKEINQEKSFGPTEQKRKVAIIDTGQEDELVSNSKYGRRNPSTRFDLESWTDSSDTSVINIVKVGRDSAGTSIANCITNETSQFDKDSDIFQSIPEGGDQCDFVDYGWANIGSFDDLDRIFSNNPMFEEMTVHNVEETWSSSKDIAGSATRLVPTAGAASDLPFSPQSSSDRSEIKTECVLDSNQSFDSVHEMLNEVKSHGQKDVQNFGWGEKKDSYNEKQEDGRAPMANANSDKGCKQKRLIKGNKVEEKREMKQMHNKSSIWCSPGNISHQVGNQLATSMDNSGPSSVICQQMTNPVQQKHFASPNFSSHLYENMAYPYPTMSATPQFHSVEGNHQSANQSSRMMSVDAAVKPSSMTPREKIEKLRRRQQLRAMLAIQKQQQRLSNQALGAEYSNMEGGNLENDENASSFPSINPNSSLDVNDTSSASVPSGNCSVDGPELYQLQNTISNLDNQIRLCIRDSLFRLSQSAMQRQCPSATRSANRSNKDIVIYERFTKIPDAETDTNPIDRTVAHLLFHRPLDFSAKLAETLNSTLTADVSFEEKENILESISPRGSKTSAMYFQKNQSKNPANPSKKN